MKAHELKVFELLDFRGAEGIIAFQDRRMLLYDADTLGILRRELIETVGRKVARGLLTRLGYANGYRDAHTLQRLFPWDTPEEWYKAGLVLHALEGKAAAVRTHLVGGADGQPLEIHTEWENCQEIEQHLRHLGPATEPVCWTLTGYASGEGHLAARLEASYDLLITQRLILQAQIELNLYSKADPARLIGARVFRHRYGTAAALRVQPEIRALSRRRL